MTPAITVAWFTPGVKDTTGRLVAWASGSRFCHVGLAIDGLFYEALAHGVEANPATPRLAVAAATHDIALDPAPFAAVRAHATRAVGWERYDYLDFLGLACRLVARRAGLVFPLVLGERDAVVCSAFVADCLELAGLDLGDARDLTPADLAAYFKVK